MYCIFNIFINFSSKGKDEEKEPATTAEDNLQEVALQKLEINQIIENVFLICLDSG